MRAAYILAVGLLCLGLTSGAHAASQIAGTITCTSSTGQAGCVASSAALSDSDDWAIDNVSGFCTFDISRDSSNTIYQMYLTTKINAVSSIDYLSLTTPGFFTPPRSATVGDMEFSQITHTYADAGSTIQFNANMLDTDVGTHLTCTVYFQGHSTR